MLIKQLYSGRRKSNLIIVKDNLIFRGFVILEKFIEEAQLRNTKVHILLTEINYFEIKPSNDVVIHHYFSDPWKLLNGRETELSFDQIIDCVLSESIINEKTQVLFVICSFSSLLQMVDLDTLCKSLKRIISSNKEESPGIQVLGLLHSELLPEESKEYKYLMYMASSILVLTPKFNRPGEVNLEHRQSSGKIINEVYICKRGRELQFEIKKDKPDDEPVNDKEKLVNSTFKLTLEEKEKESRDQVVLPYLKSRNSGKIYYSPDVNDDWDDEDPDDDLEI